MELNLERFKPLLGVYTINDEDVMASSTLLRTCGSETEVFAVGGCHFFYGAGSLDWLDFAEGEDSKPVMQKRYDGEEKIEALGQFRPMLLLTVKLRPTRSATSVSRLSQV